MAPLKEVASLQQHTEDVIGNQIYSYLDSHFFKCDDCYDEESIPEQLCPRLTDSKEIVSQHLPTEVAENVLDTLIHRAHVENGYDKADRSYKALHRLINLFCVNENFKKYTIYNHEDFGIVPSLSQQLTELRTAVHTDTPETEEKDIEFRTEKLLEYLKKSENLKILDLNQQDFHTESFLKGVSENCSVLEEIHEVHLIEPITVEVTRSFCFKDQTTGEKNPCCDTLKVLDIFWKPRTDSTVDIEEIKAVGEYLQNMPNLISLGEQFPLQPTFNLLKDPSINNLTPVFESFCGRLKTLYLDTSEELNIDVKKFPAIETLCVKLTSDPLTEQLKNAIGEERYDSLLNLDIETNEDVCFSCMQKSFPNLEDLAMTLNSEAQMKIDDGSHAHFEKLEGVLVEYYTEIPLDYHWISAFAPTVKDLRIRILVDEVPDGETVTKSLLEQEFPLLRKLVLTGYEFTEDMIRSIVSHCLNLEEFGFNFFKMDIQQLVEEFEDCNLNIQLQCYDLEVHPNDVDQLEDGGTDGSEAGGSAGSTGNTADLDSESDSSDEGESDDEGNKN